jgi:hypothetical protein
MKYVWASWENKTNSQQLLIDNAPALRTRKVPGYGGGVTFSGQITTWTQTSSTSVHQLRFFTPSISKA